MAHPSLLAPRICSVGLHRVLVKNSSITASRIIHGTSLSTFRHRDPQSDRTSYRSFCNPRTSGYTHLANGSGALSNRAVCCYWNGLRSSCGKFKQLSNLAREKYSKQSCSEIATCQSRFCGEKFKRFSDGLSFSADSTSYAYACCRLQRGYSSERGGSKDSAEAGKLLSDNVVTGRETFKQQILHTISNLRRDKVLTVPNVLTLSRMLMSPVLGCLVLQEHFHLACAGFFVAGITDVLDGYIARNYANQTSELGSFIDPLADKFLVSILFVSLTAVNLIPMALTALVLVRDVCLTIAGFYVRYISLDPRPTSLRQFFDLTNRSASLQPTAISKANTVIQLSLVAITLGAPVFGYIGHPALQALCNAGLLFAIYLVTRHFLIRHFLTTVVRYLTASTTLISGIGYIFAKDTFKLLQQSRKKP